MALDSKVFKTRTLTAIVFVIVMLAGLLWNKWSFIVLFTIIHFGCWYEFVSLMKKINPSSYKLISVSGLVYITLPIVLLLYMRLGNNINYDNNFLKIIPYIIIFSIWINDTMAYIVGSLIGKTPLSKISPKKTWEGTLGGALLAVLVIGFSGHFLSFDFIEHPFPGRTTVEHSYIYFLIPVICAIFGTMGDLFESKLKRMANVKDSGTLMPGHGGFLDRFDSLLVATPFVALYCFFIM